MVVGSAMAADGLRPGNGPGGVYADQIWLLTFERRGPPRDERYDQLRRRQH